MVEHTQTVRRLLPTNFLSVFDHTNNYNLATKTIHSNTTQPLQQTSHKLRQNRHQTNTIHPQHITTSLSHPIPQLFHQQISPDIINLILQPSNQATSQKRHR